MTIQTLAETAPTQFFNPSLRLQPYIQCYWLSMHNQASHYPVLPDGCIDLVFDLFACDLLTTAAPSILYGTTTSMQLIDIRPHTHYLGIRFRAGQGRHFINTATQALTNNHLNADQLLRQCIQPVFEQISRLVIHKCNYIEVTNTLNRYFEDCLALDNPQQLVIDEALWHIQHSSGQQRIQHINNLQTLSSRQFQRLFKQHTGISAKQYAAICRFQHAIHLIMQGNSLVNTALDAGFSDQSHFNHDIKKLTGLPPRQFFQQHVAFLQDQQTGKA